MFKKTALLEKVGFPTGTKTKYGDRIWRERIHKKKQNEDRI